MRRFGILVFCLLLAFSTVLRAQEDDQITLSLDNADIIDLVRWAADITDKNIIVHPNVSGRVTVIAGEPMSQDEAYDVFLSILQINELAIVESEDALQVVPEALARQGPLPVTEDEVVSTRDDMIVHVLTVENVSAADIISIVRPLAPQSAYLAAYPQTNKLIVADRANNIRKLMDLISTIDQADSFDIEIIQVLYANAREVAQIIENLVPRQSGNGQNANYNLTIDERTNSLLMTGDPVIRQQLKLVVERLDMPTSGSGNTQILPVEYADASELVPILENMIGNLEQGASEPNRTEVSIQAHPSLNALIITAPPALMSSLASVVQTLDQPRPQVLVEAIIVEVNLQTLSDLGFQFQSDVATSPENEVIGSGAFIPNSLAPISVTSDGEIVPGSGLSLGYFRGGNIYALFSALAGETNANILSTPSIVALDNEEASILVGENVPFITGSESREGSNPFQTIQRQDIGVTLTVTPRVNNNNSITLNIEQTVESISQSAANTADIVTNKREISTRVQIANDEILVLGGLIRDEISESQSKIPLLGDLPVIGRVFRSNSNNVDKKNLMVFIHPVILDSSASRSAASEERYNQMRDLQLDFSRRVDQILIPGRTPVLPEIQP